MHIACKLLSLKCTCSVHNRKNFLTKNQSPYGTLSFAVSDSLSVCLSLSLRLNLAYYLRPVGRWPLILTYEVQLNFLYLVCLIVESRCAVRDIIMIQLSECPIKTNNNNNHC